MFSLQEVKLRHSKREGNHYSLYICVVILLTKQLITLSWLLKMPVLNPLPKVRSSR